MFYELRSYERRKKRAHAMRAFYVIEHRSDDWGRSDQRGHMECKKCRTDHV